MCQQPRPDRQPDFTLMTNTKVVVDFWLDLNNSKRLYYKFGHKRWDDQSLVSVIKNENNKLFFAHREDDWHSWNETTDDDDLLEIDVLSAWNKIITHIESILLESEPL
jgi:hypothetical protein